MFKILGKFQSHAQNRAQRSKLTNWYMHYTLFFWISGLLYKYLKKNATFGTSLVFKMAVLDVVQKVFFLCKNLYFRPVFKISHFKKKFFTVSLEVDLENKTFL